MEHDSDMIETPIKRGPPKVLVFLVLAVVGVLAMGGVGMIAGAGFMGYRTWMYEGGALYILNFNDQAINISVDGADGVNVPAENARTLDILGGTSEVKVTDAKGKVMKTYSVEARDSHAMLKLGEGVCVVVLDISNYYRKGGDKQLKVVHRMTEDQTLYVPESTNVIWPRASFPTQYNPGSGTLYWFEKVACELLKDEEEHMLLGYMGQRLTDRMMRQQDSKKKGPVRQTL